MVLYHVVSSYHLLNAMVHVKKYKEPATVMISEWLVEKYKNIDNLIEFFQEIIVIDSNFRFFHLEKENNEYFEKKITNLNKFTKKYIWGAHFSFGIYLIENNETFILCEDGAGLASKYYILENIDKNDSVKAPLYDYMKENGLYDGETQCVKCILCNVNAQDSRYNNTKKIEDFDLVQELKNLSTEERDKIIHFFMPSGLRRENGKNDVLLLTQHFSNLKVLDFEKHALIYQFLVDYFLCNKSLIIKPHPDDLMYYNQLFSEASIIREKFPSEFLPFVLSEQPECVATISSTAIFNLRGHYPKVFELDSRYEQDFEMTHRYYAAVCIAKKLGLNIICVGANDILVQRLCESIGADDIIVQKELSEKYEKTLIIIDDMTEQGEQGRKGVIGLLHSVPKDSCVVFINSKKDYCWYEYTQKDLWDSIIPVVLQKKVLEPQAEDFYAFVDDEVLYIYSANKELLSMAKEVQIEKELPHVGIRLSNQSLTPEQEKIKMLEGILAATEKRLLYYIEKEQMKK